ncbi:hypothetical protein SAMN05421736_1161, partial [Evansella caseinilytica]
QSNVREEEVIVSYYEVDDQMRKAMYVRIQTTAIIDSAEKQIDVALK